MLTRLRKKLAIFVMPIARAIAKSGASPNLVTVLGLAISFLAPPLALVAPYAVPIVIALSSYMDAIDGAIARLTGRVSRRGAFLDSFSDRVEELMYAIALGIMGIPMVAIAIFIATSYLISYLRALGELRGIKMEGIGLFERGERILVVLATSILLVFLGGGPTSLPSLLIYLAIALNIATVIQRFVHVWKNIKENVT